MKIEKRGSSYRVRKTHKGKTYTMSFDHKPTQSEITEAFKDMLNAPVNERNAPKKTFNECALKYLEVKKNVLSAATTRSYKSILRMLPDEFKNKRMDEFDQIYIQKYINDISAKKSPKTVENYYGFISPVMGMFMPNFNIKIKLPQVQKNEDYIPTPEEVRKVIEKCKIEKYYICFMLGANGLRRSEVIALTMDDINDDYIHVCKAKVQGDEGWVIQNYNKTPESRRNVPVSKDLIKKIKKQGFVYDGHPDKILEYLHSCQDRANVPRFKFHSLRHFYATELDQAGISSKDVQKLGGWSSDYILRKVYQHNRVEKDKAIQRKASNTIENILSKSCPDS